MSKLTEADWEHWERDANLALAEFSSEEGRWWGFTCSHHRFQLVVGDPAGRNIAIMLFWTKRLSGPIRWDRQEIRVHHQFERTAKSLDILWTLEDSNVGFRAEASNFLWARDVDACDEHSWKLWRPRWAGETDE